MSLMTPENVRVNVVFRPKEDKGEEFLAAIKPLVEGTNKEEGCLHFQFYDQVYNGIKNEVKPEGIKAYLLVELWKDQAALDFHLTTDYVKTFLAAWDGGIKSEEMQIRFLKQIT